MTEDQRLAALERLNANDLVATNPRVINLAQRLRWKPETLVWRGIGAFPSVFEQRLYVASMRWWRRPAHPETIAACFHYFNNGQELCATDFYEKGNGRRILEKTGQTLLLMSRGFVASETAMRLIERCGNADVVYSIVGEALQELMRAHHIHTASREAMMAIMRAIAYAHEEHPELLQLDIVNSEDVARLLGQFAFFDETRWEDEGGE